MRHVFLYAGDIIVSEEQPILTVLGTCVSVCLYDRKKQYGAMNHFLLPYWNGDGLATSRYGNIAVDRLLEAMMEKGSQKHYLTAKVFGGMMPLGRDLELSVGRKNIEFVFVRLKELKIKIISYDVGKDYARKILMDPKTGNVKMKKVTGKS